MACACGSLSFSTLRSHIPIPTSSSSSSSSVSPKRAISCSVGRATAMASLAAPPMPSLNPRDPFLAKLAFVAAANPDIISSSRPRSDSDLPPFLDLFESPKLMASPAQVEQSVSYNEHRPRKPPPDLPSLLLHGRIVYIGMPLVPAVTELVIAELLYLQWMDPNQPIYMYINSTGTTRDDGETVGMESEGFAIYDAMMQLKNEVISNRDTLVKLLAKHTGNSVEKVSKVMSRPFYMDSLKAREFGVIDKILWRGQEKIIDDAASPEEWDRKAGIRVVEGM